MHQPLCSDAPVPASYHACDLKSLKRSHNCSNESEAAVILRCSVGVLTFVVSGFAHALKQLWVVALVISRICTDSRSEA